jgi:hypothetical protein
MAGSIGPRAAGKRGEFRCRLCDHLLELVDGSGEVALRLTVEPEKPWEVDVFLN